MTDVAAPLLEMLWEDDDPVKVIAARFGLGDATAAGRWVAATVGEHWGVEVDSVTRIVMSGHNALAWISATSGPFLAKWSVLPTKFPRLTALTQLTAWLGEQGLPVSAPVPSLDGRLQVETGERTSMSLQHQITGLLLDVAEPQQVRAAGAALAKLHLALAGYPHIEDMGSFAGPPKPLAERITDWLESGRSGALTPAAREQMIGFLAGAPSERLSAQLVHGDFRSSNILCAGHDITAVLDFEEARFDYPIMELAQSAVMLGTRFRDWGPVPPAVHTWLREGYESERSLTTAEAGWWNLLVLWFSFLLVPPGEDPTGWGPAAHAESARMAG
jgi:homoserine kinase type II